MSQPPTMSPERFSDLAADAVNGFTPASPPIDMLRGRAFRRRRTWLGVAGVVVVAAGTAGVAIPLAAKHSPSTTTQVLSIRPAPHPFVSGYVPQSPVPGLGPTPSRQQQRHERQGIRTCRTYANEHSFLQATSAVSHADGSVTITGHQSAEKCGGPDDVSYVPRKPATTFVLAQGGTVRVVVIGRAHDRKIPAAELPDYLRHTEFGFFRYAGPANAITSLIELYHP